MLKLLTFITLLMSIFAFGDCTETECDRQTLTRLTTIAAVLEDQDASVLDLSQERAYVNPQRVFINNKGQIILETPSQTIALPELFSSAEGCYVSCSQNDLGMLSQVDEIRIWWCDTCQAFRSMDKKGRCTRCGRKL